MRPVGDFIETTDLARILASATDILAAESPDSRPPDAADRPGGLVQLPGIPVILVPDLHTRTDFLRKVLSWRPGLARPEDSRCLQFGALSVLELLGCGRIGLVCLGDAINSEGLEASWRWKTALNEYFGGWKRHEAMDAEMNTALETMRLVMELKIANPERFHFLKGNHDNLADRTDHGDRHFYKYAAESAMGASWFAEVYGRELLESWRTFELGLPVAAAGMNFATSHAEPAFALTRQDIIGYRDRPDVVTALIWTANDAADPAATSESLSNLLAGIPPGDRTGSAVVSLTGARWYGGHRPVHGLYETRAEGRYIQFHNPDYRQIALIFPDLAPDPEDSVIRL